METIEWLLADVSLRAAVEHALVDRHGLIAVSQATSRWLKQSVERLVVYLGHDPGIEAVTPRQLSEWVQSEVGRGVSPVTVNSYLRAIKTLYSRLQKNGIVGTNPAAPVPFLPEPPPRPKAISREDYEAMRAVADNARDRAIVDVLWASGCRLGGLASMRVDRMERWTGKDGSECFALLVTEKFSKPRWVYVGRERQEGDSLAAYLDERLRTNVPFLWLAHAWPIRKMSYQTFESVLQKLRDNARIPAGRPSNAHSFRHAFAIRMLDEGEDIAAVSAWLGHHSPEFTAATYVVRPENRLRSKFFKQ